MPRFTFSAAVIPFLCLFLTACGSLSGGWPNLSDPLPEMQRQTITADPTSIKPVSETVDENPLTVSTALKLLGRLRAELAAADTQYRTARDTFSATPDGSEDKALAWRKAQLQLTRYSSILNRLDSILDANQLQETGVMKAAKALYSEQEAYIAAERQTLTQLMPE